MLWPVVQKVQRAAVHLLIRVKRRLEHLALCPTIPCLEMRPDEHAACINVVIPQFHRRSFTEVVETRQQETIISRRIIEYVLAANVAEFCWYMINLIPPQPLVPVLPYHAMEDEPTQGVR